MHSLSLLICTHDRAVLLGKVLDSLNAAARPPEWEVGILVIANACTDATHALLEAYQRDAARHDWLPLNWIAEATPGKSNALNTAIPQLNSELTAMVDDDHRVNPDYLTALCRVAQAHPEVDLFCGRILPDWDGSEPAWVHDTGPYRIYPLPVPRYDLGPDAQDIHDDGPIPGGGNLFLRSEWLSRVGAFSTELGPKGHDLGGAEDLEWVRRALAMNARLRYQPEVLQHHYVDADRLRLSYLIHKAFERSASSIRIFQRVDKVPLFSYRKALGYFFRGLFSLSWPRTRFYLVRFAAALGEIKGYRLAMRDQARRGH